jgi:hypothetical protein
MNTMKKAHEIRRAAARKWNCKVSEIHFGECLRMAHMGEEIKMATEQQLALQKGIKDTAAHFKAHLLVKTAADDIYEQLAMIYMAYRAGGMSHDEATKKSFLPLNGGTSENPVALAEKNIAREQHIIKQVKAQAGL